METKTKNAKFKRILIMTDFIETWQKCIYKEKRSGNRPLAKLNQGF
jgi:hypothetical protein